MRDSPLAASPKIRLRRVLSLAITLVVLVAAGFNIWAYLEYRAAQEASARYDFAASQDYFERCLQIWFLSPQVHLAAARAARRAGNLKEAETHLLESGASAGHNAKLDLELKLLRIQQGGAIDQELVRLLDQDSLDAVVILEVLTPAYIHAYQLSSAMECTRRWLEIEPDRLTAWRYRAQV